MCRDPRSSGLEPSLCVLKVGLILRGDQDIVAVLDELSGELETDPARPARHHRERALHQRRPVPVMPATGVKSRGFGSEAGVPDQTRCTSWRFGHAGERSPASPRPSTSRPLCCSGCWPSASRPTCSANLSRERGSFCSGSGETRPIRDLSDARCPERCWCESGAVSATISRPSRTDRESCQSGMRGGGRSHVELVSGNWENTGNP